MKGRPVRFLAELQAIVAVARRQHKEHELRHLSRELEEEYVRMAGRPQDVRTLDAQLALADLGPAALAIGKHLLVHGDPRAKRWLQLAAECRVGDAAYRLAKLHEGEEVARFNADMALHIDGEPPPEPALLEPALLEPALLESPLEPAPLEPALPEPALPGPALASDASRWFRRAAEEGYGRDFDTGNAGESPALALDCCQPVAIELQRGVADELLESARGEAAEIVETARADARVIREDCQAMLALARTEFSMLTARSRALEEIIRQQAATLQELVVDPDPPSPDQPLWTVRLWTVRQWTVRLRAFLGRLFRRPGRRGR